MLYKEACLHNPYHFAQDDDIFLHLLFDMTGILEGISCKQINKTPHHLKIVGDNTKLSHQTKELMRRTAGVCPGFARGYLPIDLSDAKNQTNSVVLFILPNHAEYPENAAEVFNF